MFKRTVLSAALTLAFACPPSAAQMSAAPAAASASTKSVSAAEAPATAPTYPAASAIAAGNGGGGGFNPSESQKLRGSYANQTQDPKNFRMQGFLLSGEEVGPGKRGLKLGESELTLASNIDPDFSGLMSVALAPDN